MNELKNVLMVSKPISPPWNDSNKNLTRNIIQYVNNVAFHILTPKGYYFDKQNVVSEDIYQSVGDYAPIIQQNLQALFYLITVNKEIDLFHFFYTPNSNTSTVLKHLTKFKNRPSIQTVMSSPRDYSEIKNLLFADSIITLSDYNLRKLNIAGLYNVIRIYPGIDLEKVDKAGKISSSFRLKNNLEDVNLILFAGDYEFSGANRIILDSIPRVVSKYPNTKFIFACREKTEESLTVESQAKQYTIDIGVEKYVMHLGTVSNMYEILKEIDICVYPAKSLYAKMDIPLVLIEAMAFGKPLIITDVPPLNEIMQDEIGFKISVDDKDSFVKSIIDLLEDNDLRQKFSLTARTVVEKHFNMNNLSKKYEQIYEAMLNE